MEEMKKNRKRKKVLFLLDEFLNVETLNTRSRIVKIAARKRRKKFSMFSSIFESELLWLMRTSASTSRAKKQRQHFARNYLFTLNTMTNIYNWIIFCLCSLLELFTKYKRNIRLSCHNFLSFFFCCLVPEPEFPTISTLETTAAKISYLSARQSSCIIIISKCK